MFVYPQYYAFKNYFWMNVGLSKGIKRPMSLLEFNLGLTHWRYEVTLKFGGQEKLTSTEVTSYIEREMSERKECTSVDKKNYSKLFVLTMSPEPCFTSIRGNTMPIFWVVKGLAYVNSAEPQCKVPSDSKGHGLSPSHHD